MSHLLQMRGLKLEYNFDRRTVVVASFTDAWIETRIFNCLHYPVIVASFTDAWIET